MAKYAFVAPPSRRHLPARRRRYHEFMAEKTIENISDTALWVAVYRAWETERPDAHFRDPYAKMLAGERGEEIVKKIRGGKRSAWAMIVRTAVFDEIIMRCINKEGVDTVINLAAGLDTRPYRLPLPASLRWIEVDLPGIFDYKEEKLRDQKPVCRLERVRLDLADEAARQQLFLRIASESKQALVLSEGLLVYLSREQVASLARDLAAQQSFRWWLIDLVSPVLFKMLKKWYSKTLNKGGVVMQFAPEEGTDFFKPYGWKLAEFRSTMIEARRLNRTMAGASIWRILGYFYPKKAREGFLRAGMVLLERT